jgi:pilus assembly protein Flp/PilA
MDSLRTTIDAIICRATLATRREEGQGMIEYGLLVALISIVAIATITLIGGGLTNNFQSVLNAL